jgi:hypothetical protein
VRRRGRFPWRERGLRFNNPNVGMSSHNYATDHLDLPAQNAQRQSRRALLMSVFGATTDPTVVLGAPVFHGARSRWEEPQPDSSRAQQTQNVRTLVTGEGPLL